MMNTGHLSCSRSRAMSQTCCRVGNVIQEASNGSFKVPHCSNMLRRTILYPILYANQMDRSRRMVTHAAVRDMNSRECGGISS